MTEKKETIPMEEKPQGPVPVTTQAAIEADVALNVENGSHLITPGQKGDARDADPRLQHDPVTGDLILEKKTFDPNQTNSLTVGIYNAQTKLYKLCSLNKGKIFRCIGLLLLVAYFAYFAYAMYCGRAEGEGSIRLLVCTIFGLLLLVLNLCSRQLGAVTDPIYAVYIDPNRQRLWRNVRWVLYIVSATATVTVIIVMVATKEPDNLVSIAGLAAFILICFVTSHNPAMVDWHPIFWGFSIQFYFAVVILKTRWGFETFRWLGDRVTEFLSYSDAGAAFVFGDFAEIKTIKDGPLIITSAYTIHFFAFKIMPVITFFSTIISVFYYLGVMQAIIRVIGHFLSFCLGTTPAESLNAAGNIFVAMTESPLMIRPFLPKMTSSELHAVMTGGFATIAGSVLGAYIQFGVPADHLLSASVMSAPAALAISKLTYPEIEVPIVSKRDYDTIKKKEYGNVIEAACSGAAMSGKIIASVIVNVIAFLSLLAFVNATLTWFGDRVNVDKLTFELICSYVLYPVALFMGTERADCRKIAQLVGVKTFTNEFIAYQQLSVFIRNRKDWLEYQTVHENGTWYYENDDIVLNTTGTILKGGLLSPRSEVIATYALCGFSNFGSMGVLLGGLTALAPKRRPTMSKLILRAMIAGNIACFFTACIAGLFYEEFD